MCLIITILSIYAMSIIGFSGIMTIALPILEILYPALIIYCIIVIYLELFGKETQARRLLINNANQVMRAP